MSPAEEKALLQQGIAAARAGDKPAARARFRELTGKNFDNELAWLWLASVADTPAHAMACLRRVLQINDGNDKARAALFRLLMEKGIEAARANDKSSAYALFQEASALDPSSELVWTWLASTAPAPPQALTALRRVLQLNAAHDQAGRAFKKLIVQQSIELAQAGDPGARDLLTEATTVDPRNELLWLWLARSVPPAEAIALYERVLEINPSHDAARAALQQLRPEPPAADDVVYDEPSAPDLESELDADFDSELEAADLDEEMGGVLLEGDAAGARGAYANGHAANGHAVPHANGHANGHGNGHNGHANGHGHAGVEGDRHADAGAGYGDEDIVDAGSHGHGYAGLHDSGNGNGHGHGHGNGHGHANGIGAGYGEAIASPVASGLGGQKPSHTIDLSQLNLEDDSSSAVAVATPASPQDGLAVYHGSDISAAWNPGRGAEGAAAGEAAPLQYETNADYSGASQAAGAYGGASAYTADPAGRAAYTTASDYGTGAGYGAERDASAADAAVHAAMVQTTGYENDVDSYVAASERAYADSVSLTGAQELEITRNGDYGDASAGASVYGGQTAIDDDLQTSGGLSIAQANADAYSIDATIDGEIDRIIESDADLSRDADGDAGIGARVLTHPGFRDRGDASADASAAAGEAANAATDGARAAQAAGASASGVAGEQERGYAYAGGDAGEMGDTGVAGTAAADDHDHAGMSAAAASAAAIAESHAAAASSAGQAGNGGNGQFGSILGVSQVVPAPSAVSSGQGAWDCPICLSGAPEGAVRCPNCGSVVSLDDPDLLMQTDNVDRRHVLQVVARLKNRAAGSDQFDHQFTLGLAYINANRMTEGLGHLRMASQLRPRDQRLKGQIDALERRAAQGARRSKTAAPAPVAATPAASARPATVVPDVPAPPPAESAAGDGSLLDTPQPVSASGASAGVSGGGSETRRVILVVDDSPTIQKVVSVTLEAHGHEVVTASDGMEALSKLRTLKPDLVLLDITMPHMDGYQLCRILRSNDLTRQVPIVMLSGKDGLFDKMRGRMAGAATYITKPFAPSALPPLVDKYCKRG